MNVGARVGVLMSDAELVGYGVFEGNRSPMDFEEKDRPVGFTAETAQALAADERWTNPCIRLDSGEIAWGCETWWGPEDRIKAKVAATPGIKTTTMAEVRADYAASQTRKDG